MSAVGPLWCSASVFMSLAQAAVLYMYIIRMFNIILCTTRSSTHTHALYGEHRAIYNLLFNLSRVNRARVRPLAPAACGFNKTK